jgi:hypothetical protein
MSGVEHWLVETFNGLGQRMGLVYLIQNPGECTVKVTHFEPPPEPTAREIIEEAIRDGHDPESVVQALREARLLREDDDDDDG